ncbi:sensor histidine kinase [Ureibacillus sinduriensis]|uniref:histidine kinase n=1 Tax=Ureibacillus sinduriensis BLB-1 = JCM 15800 TaxID=1384057 RepID=A0A0A3HZ19_9BACL|nr:histidine kinase [Ureibacillus sinduriensis]KGR75638.1 histidine kinase [Ureibacillus sinduriensis BLB-1 = JCM 15800]
MSYRLLQFISVLLPTILIGGFEYIRHDFLLHSLSMEAGNLYITILTFVLSLLFSIWMFRTIKAMNNKLVSEQSKRAVYEERERLARELHDGIAQSIFYMNIKLKQNDIEAASRALSTIDNHVRQAIFNLRSEPEIDDSLHTRITKWHSEWSQVTGIEVEEDIQIPHNYFTTKEEVQIFAIIQEAFANIRKHAQASKAIITMREITNTNGWQLKIVDNGSGIDMLKKSSRQYGLSMMEERSKQLGAILQVINSQNGGTEIIVTKEKQ